MSVLKTLQKFAGEDPYGREICGIVDRYDTIFVMKNISDRPFVSYKFDEDEFASVLAEIGGIDNVQLIYHSHPSGDATPSEEDVRCSEALGIDYLIVTPTDFTYHMAANSP